MAVYNLTIKHFRFQQLSILFSLFMITNFFCVLTPFTFTSAISFYYQNNSSDPDIFLYDEYAHTVGNQGIQLTDNTSWSIGRVTYFRPMHLWDKNSKNLTDFDTTFYFTIDLQGQTTNADGVAIAIGSPDQSHQTKLADGLAFFLAPNGSKTSSCQCRQSGSL